MIKLYSIAFLVLLVSLQAYPVQSMENNKPYTFNIKNAQEKPDFSRLPKFHTSDPAYDDFLNDYFMRHLSVDDRSIYTGGVKLGIVDHMWVIEWDQWMMPWIDRGAMGLYRQGNSPSDAILQTLANCPVDKYGYIWGGTFYTEPNNSLGGYKPNFCWPWPKYNRNYTVKEPTGWDFNDPADGARDKWTVRDIELQPGYVDFCLKGKITGSKPELISPKFDCDVYQIPIVELDVAFKGTDADKRIGGLKIYWTTDKSPRFSEDRMVTVNYCDLPPKDFSTYYTGYVTSSSARYPLNFPMLMHPGWGREGNRITRLKVVPTGPGAEGTEISINYVRATYDVRLTTSNTTLIGASYRFYMWSGDDEYLKTVMPKLRKSMIFLNEHLKGRKDGLLNLEWYAGHDGLGGMEPGHGVHGSYWDLLPSGKYDIESSLAYYDALLAMAELEKVAKDKGFDIPSVTVIGPDDKSILTYNDTPETLKAIAKRVKKNIEEKFWVKETGRFCRNVDVNGKQHDYGFLHFNVLALASGVGTPAQRDSILSWLDGRVIPGDTATGEDIYHWRFGPRTSTRWNTSYYYWAWNWDRKAVPDLYQFRWGDQMQDGGAVPFTSFFELISRTGSGRQEQIDKAFARTKEIQKWFDDVKSAGGRGSEFYRTYYKDHPERGIMQSPSPGGIGLDHEFLSDSSLGTNFLPFAFLGLRAFEDKILDIAPSVPSQLEKIGVENVFYRGNHLKVEAGKNYVSLEGSKISNAEGLRVRIALKNLPKDCKLTIDNKPFKEFKKNRDGSITITTDLRPVRITY